MFIAKFLQIFLYYTFYPLAKFIFHIEIHPASNLRNLDLSNKLILAANHVHFLDSTIGAWAFTKYLRSLKYPFSKILPIRFVAAAEYFNFFKAPPFFPLSLIYTESLQIHYVIKCRKI